MTNLIKLCVGIKTVNHLKEFRQTRRETGHGRKDGYDVHRTRMMPKRREEIIGKGSIYWVIAGKIQCRQLIVDLDRQYDSEGKKCCDIVMDSKIITTIPTLKRAFQGWRYFEQASTPSDIDIQNGEGDLELAAQLSQLGLI